jgi:hypothetical protein
MKDSVEGRSLLGRRRRSDATTLLCVCVVIIGFSTSASTVAADTPIQRYGIVAGWDTNVAAKFSELGAGVLRTPCEWADMEPSRGNFTWGCSDARIYGATGAGLQVLLTAQCTPSWARTGGGCYTLPDSLSDWYNFVAAFVQHYSGYNVVLGIYNEPNLNGMSAAQYAWLAEEASWARSAYAPNFRLAMPETSDGAGQWFIDAMTYIRSAGALAPQDVITVHWYSGGPTFDTYIDAVRSNSGGNNDVWLSETGYSVSGGEWYQNQFYEARLAEFDALCLTRPWWKKIIFYSLVDDQYYEGIVNSNWTNRTAFTTLQWWIQRTTIPSLSATSYLFQDQQVDSVNALCHLYYQADGNLVLYDQYWNPLWASDTDGTTPGYTVMQSDGNLVVYDGSNVWRYQSGTGGHPGAYAVVQDWGVIAIFDADGTPLKQIY